MSPMALHKIDRQYALSDYLGMLQTICASIVHTKIDMYFIPSLDTSEYVYNQYEYISHFDLASKGEKSIFSQLKGHYTKETAQLKKLHKKQLQEIMTIKPADSHVRLISFLQQTHLLLNTQAQINELVETVIRLKINQSPDETLMKLQSIKSG